MGRTLPEALLAKLWLRHPLQMFMFVPHIRLFFLSSFVNVYIIRPPFYVSILQALKDRLHSSRSTEYLSS